MVRERKLEKSAIVPGLLLTNAARSYSPSELDIDIESLTPPCFSNDIEVCLTPIHSSLDQTPLPPTPPFNTNNCHLSDDHVLPPPSYSYFKSKAIPNMLKMTPLPPTPPTYSPIIQNIQTLPLPPLPALSQQDQTESLHAQNYCLTKSFPGEPLAPILNSSSNQKHRNLKVSFSNDVKRAIIDDLDVKTDTFDAGELLEELNKLTSM